jgi:DNA-binding CsgD family transcriptional regulator
VVLWEQRNAVSWQAQAHAMQAWYDAECARAEAADDEGTLWLACVDAFVATLLPWDELYARYRAASSLLRRPSTRSAGVAQLRRGLELADDLEADPIREELDRLATAARIPVDPVVSAADVDPADELTVANTSLTKREKEILGHIVAGRTYAEIARELVISEKTVSVHVSNLLRKTGTSGRLELAQLVHRTGRTGHSEA